MDEDERREARGDRFQGRDEAGHAGATGGGMQRGAGDLTRPVPVREFPPLPDARRVRTVNVGAVLGGLVLLAVAAWVTAREVTGSAWDWRWSAAGVLLLSGLCVVVAAVVSAVRQRDRSGEQR